MERPLPPQSPQGTQLRPGYLFVLPWYPKSPIGGVNQVLIHLIGLMKAEGNYEPFLLIPAGNQELPPSPYIACPIVSMVIRDPVLPTLRAPIAFFLTLPVVLWRLRAWLVRHRIAAINSHFPSGDSLTYVLLRRLGLFSGKVILSIHGNDIKDAFATRGFKRFLIRLTLRLADTVVACSHGLLKDLLRLEPGCARNSVVIHNAIDAEGFEAKIPPGFVLPGDLRDVPYLLNIGRYEHKKGQDLLIRAFNRIAPDFPLLRLVMIGGTGPEVEQVRQQVAESPFRERIVMMENVPHETVPGYLKASALFVLPSRREGLPFAILEAAACRRAVVAAACIGVPELIEDAVTGRLVPVDDYKALESAIRDLLNDEAARTRCAQALRDLVDREFTWPTTYRKYLSVS